MAEIIRRLDARNSTTSSGTNYFVVFCSRRSPGSSLPGHAFVVWGKEDSANGISSQQSFGFYPDAGDETRAVFTTVPGRLVDEATNPGSSALLTARLIVQVDRDDFDVSQGQIPLWRTSTYQLFSRNCIGFAHAVATALGIFPPQPTTFETPEGYLLDLIEHATGLRSHRGAPQKAVDVPSPVFVETAPAKKLVSKLFQVGNSKFLITSVPNNVASGEQSVKISISPSGRDEKWAPDRTESLFDCICDGLCFCDSKTCGCDDKSTCGCDSRECGCDSKAPSCGCDSKEPSCGCDSRERPCHRDN